MNTLETLSYKLKSGRKLEAKDDSASRYSAIDEEGKSSAKRSSPGLAKGGRPKHGDYQSSNFQQYFKIAQKKAMMEEEERRWRTAASFNSDRSGKRESAGKKNSSSKDLIKGAMKSVANSNAAVGGDAVAKSLALYKAIYKTRMQKKNNLKSE